MAVNDAAKISPEAATPCPKDAGEPGAGVDHDATVGPCSQLVNALFRPRAPSGHSIFRKARFALSLWTPFLVIGIVGAAKDIYLEKFGLSAKIMGLIVPIISFWAPFQEIIMGRLQDRMALARCFPATRWGRRAPWLLTHCCVAVLGISVIFLPPEGDLAYVWYVVVGMSAMWGVCGCILAFEAARQELYPFKEERIVSESLCKYACMAGGAAGGVVFVGLSVDASLPIRAAFIAYIVPMGLISLQAVPIFMETRRFFEARVGDAGTAQPASGHPPDFQQDPSAQNSDMMGILAILWEAFPLRLRMCLRRCLPCSSRVALLDEKPDNRALQHLLAMKFWNGAYGVANATLLIYYVTYVLRLSGWKRVQVGVFSAGGAGIAESLMNVVYARIFASGDGLTDVSGSSDRLLLRTVIWQRLCNTVLTVVLIIFVEPSVVQFLVFVIVARTNLCSSSFWRVSAACWLTDEDCIGVNSGARTEATAPRRCRQGTIFGALSMSVTFAGALFNSLIFMGLGLAGFQTKNCEAHCRGSAEDDCADVCFRDVIDGQPESLRLYIRAILGLFAPMCELLVTFHVWSFPIKGLRLRRLYQLVAATRGIEDVEASGGSRSCKRATPHAGASLICLLALPGEAPALVSDRGGAAAVGAGLAGRLEHTIALARMRPPRKSSLSVTLDACLLGIAERPPGAALVAEPPVPAASPAPPDVEPPPHAPPVLLDGGFAEDMPAPRAMSLDSDASNAQFYRCGRCCSL